jgi:hypothetical protein
VHLMAEYNQELACSHFVLEFSCSFLKPSLKPPLQQPLAVATSIPL